MWRGTRLKLRHGGRAASDDALVDRRREGRPSLRLVRPALAHPRVSAWVCSAQSTLHTRKHIPMANKQSTETTTTTTNETPTNFQKNPRNPKRFYVMSYVLNQALLINGAQKSLGRSKKFTRRCQPCPGRLSKSASPCSSVTMCHQRAIEDADASEEMQQDSGEWATQASEKNDTEKDIVARGRRSVTRGTALRGTALWGAAPGSSVMQGAKLLIESHLGQVAVLLFNSGKKCGLRPVPVIHPEAGAAARTPTPEAEALAGSLTAPCSAGPSRCSFLVVAKR